jgi:hypothetical protein
MWGFCEQRAVVLNRASRGVAPCPAVDDTLTASRTDAVAQGFIVERRAQHRGKRFAVTGRNDECGFVVVTNDLRKSAAAGRNERNTAAHRFDRWQ